MVSPGDSLNQNRGVIVSRTMCIELAELAALDRKAIMFFRQKVKKQ